jgi:hypothetical protein
MTIQHASIPDGKRHEPKGISTAANKSVYKADGAASGTWSRLTEVDLDYSDKTKNIFGWNDIADNQYTSGAPRAISSGVRTLLTNNGLAAQTDTSRLGTIWNTGSSQFLINDLNGFYSIRVAMKITAAAAAGTPYVVTFEAESANGPTVIIGSTQMIKGGGYVNLVTFQRSLYSGSFINNQALKLYITPDTNINIYDIGFVVHREYKET